MTYEEFEWQILRLVYEEGLDRLKPSYLAYAMGLPHGLVSQHLERAVEQGVLELDVAEQGRLEYYIPGVDRQQPLPAPLWRAQTATAHEPLAAAEPPEQTRQGADGSVVDRRQPPAAHAAGPAARGPRPEPPATLKAHLRDSQSAADGATTHTPVVATAARPQGALVLARHAQASEPPPLIAAAASASSTTALVPYAAGGAMLQVESAQDAFCDPSQTIFMRQLRVHGVQSEALLRDHIQRLFESFGYKLANQSQERLRFERGSVTFILALVPLFVLILPLFVYLFLYCMGRSTIQQEPLELDVHIRQNPHSQTSYDIDLTFIGLHGVVLGAADQRVLSQEIDTLRDELRWALAAH